MKIQPEWADKGDKLRLRDTWCKGKRERILPIRTASQRAVLERGQGAGRDHGTRVADPHREVHPAGQALRVPVPQGRASTARTACGTNTPSGASGNWRGLPARWTGGPKRKDMTPEMRRADYNAPLASEPGVRARARLCGQFILVGRVGKGDHARCERRKITVPVTPDMERALDDPVRAARPATAVACQACCCGTPLAGRRSAWLPEAGSDTARARQGRKTHRTPQRRGAKKRVLEVPGTSWAGSRRQTRRRRRGSAKSRPGKAGRTKWLWTWRACFWTPWCRRSSKNACGSTRGATATSSITPVFWFVTYPVGVGDLSAVDSQAPRRSAV